MARPPSILFVHDDFPGQFGGFAGWLAARGWDVAFATARAGAEAEGIRVLQYAPHRRPSPETHPYAQPMDRAALNAQAFARTALAARGAGLRPDFVMSHAGPGAGMFAKDVFPRARVVPYCEWWYRFPGADVEFLAPIEPAAGPAGPEAAIHERARNAPIALELSAADAGLVPTVFQAAQFPEALVARLTVLHDGIDTERFRPDPAARRGTLGGLVAPEARVVTYATRGMEPHRGFPQFMAALPAVLAADPAVVAVIAGENRVAYGGDAIRRIDWKARALAVHGLDPARVHFVGTLPFAGYRALLQRSDAHVYLTVPFVLSWSLLEAMAVGAPLVASDTAPVREFADQGEAALVDFREPARLPEAILETLAGGPGVERRRRRARARIEADLAEPRIFAAKAQFLERLR
ncbi:MAG: glycosyltransferase [Amaricoccus sp.]|uniref:glycosyltransferase n=1 Tax=Amaricoccus sp. TaxID=1872485 RepID=UPI0039E67145